MVRTQFASRQQLRCCSCAAAAHLGGFMQRVSLVLAGTLLAAFCANAMADDTADLIAQDKAWGAAGTKGDRDAVAKFLADDVVSVDESGVRNRQAELATTEPAPAGSQYEPTDYKVTFLNADTAVMTHDTKGDDAHHSLHVWSRKGGTWQVVATSSTRIKGK